MDGLSAVVQQRLQSQARALNAAIGALREVSSCSQAGDNVGPAGSTGEDALQDAAQTQIAALQESATQQEAPSAVVQQRLQSQAQALNAAIDALRGVSSRLHSVDHVGPAGSTGEEIAVEPFAAVHTPAAPAVVEAPAAAPLAEETATWAEAREPSEPAQTAPPDAGQRTQPGHGAVVRRSFFQCELWGRACPEHTYVGVVHAACSVHTGARAFLLTSRRERARARVCTDGLVCVSVRVRVRVYTYICVHVYMHTFLYMYVR